jgi:hypothetical protein
VRGDADEDVAHVEEGRDLDAKGARVQTETDGGVQGRAHSSRTAEDTAETRGHR